VQSGVWREDLAFDKNFEFEVVWTRKNIAIVEFEGSNNKPAAEFGFHCIGHDLLLLQITVNFERQNQRVWRVHESVGRDGLNNIAEQDFGSPMVAIKNNMVELTTCLVPSLDHFTSQLLTTILTVFVHGK